MTTIRQLYELQEIDWAIEDHRGLITALNAQLAERGPLEKTREELDALRRRVQESLGGQRDKELALQSLRTKLEDLEARLYGGRVTNPRELGNMEKELTLLRGQVKQNEEVLLELMVSLEEGQRELKLKEEHTTRDHQVWQSKNVQLAREKERLEQALQSLMARRTATVAQIGQGELSLYERLRASKGGRAMAKVERGLCQGCRVALPTHQMQRVRVSREPVLCPNCGRILYSS